MVSRQPWIGPAAVERASEAYGLKPTSLVEVTKALDSGFRRNDR